jgi:hypothetical protein
MDMSSYEVEKDDSKAKEYDDEVLCAGWVPALALQLSLPPHLEDKSSIPDDLAIVDADIFMRKMYCNQR